jgi:hypothetical protein
MCFHINGDGPIENTPELTLSDQSPLSHTNILWENAACLQAWQVDLEVAKVGLER